MTQDQTQDYRGALERLITTGDFRTRFQPIVDLQRGVSAGYEALTAPGAESGFKHAGELFDAACEAGMLWPLECATRSRTLRDAAGWPAGSLLFLNCTPEVFAHKDFAETVLNSVKAVASLSPGRVVLEITEKSDSQYLDGLEEQVRRVKANGFQVAIDDVGAGASGLNRIMALRPHWLKLDRQLVQSIETDNVRQNLIRFLMHFAKLSGVRVIAEGIETQAELATLVDLGVFFGQGYFLGRPGEREQTLPEPVAKWLLERWTRAESMRFHDPRHARIVRFMRPVLKVDARRTVGDVASELMRDLAIPGVAVLDGARCAGWCDRDSLLRAAATVRVAQPIGFLVGADAPPATTQTTISEALELAASREDRHAGQPLLVEEAGEVVGLIAIRDLLHAAAEISREQHIRTVPLTGLPGRVRAEQHVRALISAAREPMKVAAAGPDAALIDIRNLSHYNGVYGYDLGDQLLKRLVALLQSVVVGDDDAVFLAHLRDDRFLLTAPRGRLESALRLLVGQFDASLFSLSASADPDAVRADETAAGEEGLDELAATFVRRPGGVSLRVVLMREPFASISSPRDLYKTGDLLRGRIDASAHASDPSDQVLVVEPSQITDLRKSA